MVRLRFARVVLRSWDWEFLPWKVVPDVAGGITEDKVQGKAFELVFAFDEVITTGGHKESITLQQVSVGSR